MCFKSRFEFADACLPGDVVNAQYCIPNLTRTLSPAASSSSLDLFAFFAGRAEFVVSPKAEDSRARFAATGVGWRSTGMISCA